MVDKKIIPTMKISLQDTHTNFYAYHKGMLLSYEAASFGISPLKYSETALRMSLWMDLWTIW